jgi:hypothetical protein
VASTVKRRYYESPTEAAGSESKTLTRFVSLLFLGVLVCDLVSPAQSHDQLNAEVKGVVTDSLDGRMPRVVLVFESGGKTYPVETGEDGTYALQLKPDTYTVSVTQRGFCGFRRAAFSARKGSKIRFDFQLWVCPSDADGRYNFIELEAAPHTHLKPLVLFGETHTEGTSQDFTGAFLSKRYPVMFTYNLLTLRAIQLRYERDRHLVWATGDVVWQDGTNEGSGQNVQVWLDGPEPRVVPFSRQD